MKLSRNRRPLLSVACMMGMFGGLLGAASLAIAQPTPAALPTEGRSVTIAVADAPKAISPHLFGIFFEDLNYAADGGLYAELVRNRSFEFSGDDRREWQPLTGWDVVRRGNNVKGDVLVESVGLVHPNNGHYVRLRADEAGEGFGLSNGGYDGLRVVAGEPLAFATFARLDGETPGPLTVRIERASGDVLAEGTVDLGAAGRWTRLTATLTPNAAADDARLVVLMTGKGTVALDDVSLFPPTFKDRPNGMRRDLSQAIADLKPRFVRFPGGCLVHGDGLANMYRWKDTIGPIEQRRAQPNIWNYHQSVGLGYFEYFQFCEDVGALPLPVVAAGVSCQNSGAKVSGRWGQGQEAIPMDEMPAYVQDVLDLIEYANGPVDSRWGAKRAAAGHPEPFNLKYLGVGNEDHITPAFEERFTMLVDAIRTKHPEIVIVGTSGPAPRGEDFEKGWDVARRTKVPMVDEHYYMPPDWFWSNLSRYDTYDRSGPKVYLGEYAAHERDRRNTLRAALAEAAHLTSLERNGDVVTLSSYAPLLCKDNHRHWQPDLIYFDNARLVRSLNYHVQHLFGQNAGETLLPLTFEPAVSDDHGVPLMTGSCVRDAASGDVIIKLVSRSDQPIAAKLNLSAVLDADTEAKLTTLAGDPNASNDFNGDETRVMPRTEAVRVSPKWEHTLPAHSLTVVRIPKGK